MRAGVKNKVLVGLWRSEGHTMEEVAVEWVPLNFRIDSDLYHEMVEAAVDGWLQENELKENAGCELIMEHIREHDAGGALMEERFDVIHTEREE